MSVPHPSVKDLLAFAPTTESNRAHLQSLMPAKPSKDYGPFTRFVARRARAYIERSSQTHPGPHLQLATAGQHLQLATDGKLGALARFAFSGSTRSERVHRTHPSQALPLSLILGGLSFGAVELADLPNSIRPIAWLGAAAVVGYIFGENAALARVQRYNRSRTVEAMDRLLVAGVQFAEDYRDPFFGIDQRAVDAYYAAQVESPEQPQQELTAPLVPSLIASHTTTHPFPEEQ